MTHFTTKAWLILYEAKAGGYDRSYRLAGICNTPARAQKKAEEVHYKLNAGKPYFEPRKIHTGQTPVTIKEVELDADNELFKFLY